MFTVTKRMTVSGAHKLNLDYPSKCSNLHGHNWVITVTLKRDDLDKNGMVYDFTKIKALVNSLDHVYINNVVDFNPTAENIAKYLCNMIPYCVRVTVQETEGNEATYERE